MHKSSTTHSRISRQRLDFIVFTKTRDATQQKKAFDGLNARGLLLRFVIDEAHCVSQVCASSRETITTISSSAKMRIRIRNDRDKLTAVGP
jgi:superfamily II DNA helicase RecQ